MVSDIYPTNCEALLAEGIHECKIRSPFFSYLALGLSVNAKIQQDIVDDQLTSNNILYEKFIFRQPLAVRNREIRNYPSSVKYLLLILTINIPVLYGCFLYRWLVLFSQPYIKTRNGFKYIEEE